MPGDIEHINCRQPCDKLSPAVVMTKRLLLIWLSMFLVVGCMLILHFHEHRTVYKGKTIDQWLEESRKADTRDAAIRILAEAGELALPDLVRTMTRKEAFLSKKVAPRLPGLLRRLVPREKRAHLREQAMKAIIIMQLRVDQIVPLLKRAIPESDEEGLSRILFVLLGLSQRDNTSLYEVAKLIPDLRQAAGTTRGSLGPAAGYLRKLEVLIQGSNQLPSWVPLGTKIEDAGRIMKEHQIEYASHTDRLSEPENILEGYYTPITAYPSDRVHFVIVFSNDKASSIRVAGEKLFR
jgi:hypothetical protein